MLVLFLVCLANGIFDSTFALEKPYYDLENAEQLFEEFILTHSKTYSNLEDKLFRLGIFKDNLKRINELNSESDSAFGITHFADLHQEEHKQYMGFVPYTGESQCENITDKDIPINDAPKELDWVAKGAVTEVKNQGGCESCWAFGTIGNLEGQYFLKTKQLKSFSEQELMDCSKSNGGCKGGDMCSALLDVKNLGGIELESEYPYEESQGSCRFSNSKVITNIAGCKRYILEDEDKVRKVLEQKGPLIIGINGVKVSDHMHGILTKKDCESDIFVGHAALLVGYGTEDGQDYWLVKNSWGPKWGKENGYFRMTRGENTCLMMNYIASADLS